MRGEGWSSKGGNGVNGPLRSFFSDPCRGGGRRRLGEGDAGRSVSRRSECVIRAVGVVIVVFPGKGE